MFHKQPYANGAMIRTLFIFVVVMHAAIFTGPVCGGHLNTMESIACCEKGHDQTSNHGDMHATNCCSNCDMGKGSSATNTHNDSSAFLRHYSKISADLVTAIEPNETEVPVSVADFS